jgi:sortase A
MTLTDSATAAADGNELPTDSPGGRRARRLQAEQAGQVTTQPDGPAAPQTTKGKDKKPRKPVSTVRGSIAWVLATVSLLVLWFVFYAIVMTPFQESHAQSVMYNTMRQKLSQQTAPLGGAIVPGTPVALISVPSLGLADVVVVEGTASGDTMAGPGHRRDTVLPGQTGVSVLYGRAALFGGPFAQLSRMHAGDKLTVTTGQGIFTYTVEGRRVAGDHLPQPLASGKGRLTLVSAVGSTRLGALSPTGAIFVDAALSGDGQPTLPGRPVVVPTSEQVMQGDPSALLPLALALPLLIGGVLFVAWTRTRWGGWQTWLVGVPILLGALWAVSQAAVQLLPNLL